MSFFDLLFLCVVVYSMHSVMSEILPLNQPLSPNIGKLLPTNDERALLTDDVKPKFKYPICEITIALDICFNENESIKSDLKIKRNISQQIEMAVVLIKSLLISYKFGQNQKQNESCIELIFFSSERKYFERIQERIFVKEKWDVNFTKYMKLSYVQAQYPADKVWMQAMEPCGTLQLLLPDILINYESLIYLNKDMILLRSIQELWKEFDSFSEIELSGMAHENKKNTTNSGIMLINLTRMRETQWAQNIKDMTRNNSNGKTLEDQNSLNSHFDDHLEEQHIISCLWSFSETQCLRSSSYCSDNQLTSEGIWGLQGNPLAFSTNGHVQPFHAIFQAFADVQLNSDFNLGTFVGKVSSAMETGLKMFPNSTCAQYKAFPTAVLKSLEQLALQESCPIWACNYIERFSNINFT